MFYTEKKYFPAYSQWKKTHIGQRNYVIWGVKTSGSCLPFPWEQVQQQRYYSTLHRFAKAGIYHWSSLNLSEFLFPTERHPVSSTPLLHSLYYLFIPKDQGFYVEQWNGDITALQDGLPEPLQVLQKKTSCFISFPFSSKFSIVKKWMC